MGTTTRGNLTKLLVLFAMVCPLVNPAIINDQMYPDALESPEPTPSYLHLCQSVKTRMVLSDETYEYKPRAITAVTCSSNVHEPSSTNRCVGGLFRCKQQTITHYVVKRRLDNPTGCWTPDTVRVPYGCECMWPTDELHVSSHQDQD